MNTQIEDVEAITPESTTTESTTTNFYQTVDAPPQSADGSLDLIMTHLGSKFDDIGRRVTMIQYLLENDTFKLASKQTRNNLLHGLLEDIGVFEEISKVAVRSLKKIKRERASEDRLDQLLLIDPDYITSAKEDISNDA